MCYYGCGRMHILMLRTQKNNGRWLYHCSLYHVSIFNENKLILMKYTHHISLFLAIFVLQEHLYCFIWVDEYDPQQTSTTSYQCL